ncbi:MAG: c-type cytochrome domain-containing protein, partial [Verrucomicrobiota bacterium]
RLKPFLGHAADELTAADQGISMDNWSIYDEIIQPIFNAKCTECHDENKVKGDLRIDSFEWLSKGGDITDQEVIPGDAEASELYFRVVLDPDDDDFMPPGDREHMTPDEIALLGWWINEGGTQEMTVGGTEKDENIERILSEMMSKTEAETEGKTAGTNPPTLGEAIRS